MPSMWRVVGALFWKNWRVKQRESKWNDKLGEMQRRGGRCRMLLPPLTMDIIVPLCALLWVIQLLCGWNVSLGPQQAAAPVAMHAQPGPAAIATGRGLSSVSHFQPGAPSKRSIVIPSTSNEAFSSVLLVQALPLLLAKTKMNLAMLDRPENREFLRHLDSEFPASPSLGLPAFSDRLVIVPDNHTAGHGDPMDAFLASPDAKSTYMALDLDAHAEHGQHATIHLMKEDAYEPQSADQLKRYIAQMMRPVNASDPRSLLFPAALPLQLELNRYLRDARAQPKPPTNASDLTAAACTSVDTMLRSTGLRWTDFSTTSPLGQSLEVCQDAMKTPSTLPGDVTTFLQRITQHDRATDGLAKIHANLLPKRPQKVAPGQLEANIIFYMAYLFLWPFTRLIRDIVTEKEKQLKEYLLILGLQPMALLLSWLSLYILASLVVQVAALYFLGDSMYVASTSSHLCFFALTWIYNTSLLILAVAVTPMFSLARTATASAPLIYMVMAAAPFLRSMVSPDTLETSELLQAVFSFAENISAPVQFMRALREVMGLDAETQSIRPIVWNDISDCCWMMFKQCIGYLVLGWYLENVFPRPIGIQQPWYFIFKPSYWFPSCLPQNDRENEEARSLTEATSPEYDQNDQSLREMSMRDYLEHFKPILYVKQLTKQYPNGKLAVKNVSFGVKRGEIFGLLGPNGAGKSTTMSILCGMLSPTSGDAFVGPTSVAKNPQSVRESLSVCFQQNILWDDLTAFEHIELICALKQAMGIQTIGKGAWVSKLRQFGLEDKQDARAKTLSGGQKRKLSLILALLDNSRLVLLDEPTAGMDLNARLDTWEALKKAVQHRAVILTTHSMQEAQALCENIGIVADGQLKCCGSSLFLREKLGVGYKLTIVHHESNESDNNAGADGAKHAQVLALVKEYVPTAVIVSENKWETRLQLAEGDETLFVPLLERLERMRKEGTGGIKRYAIAATDLEDVFVKVTEGEGVYYHAKDDEVHSDTDEKHRAKMASMAAMLNAAPSNRALVSTQCRALVRKRWLVCIRDKRALLAQFVWPLVLFAGILAFVHHLGTLSKFTVESLTSLPRQYASSPWVIASSADANDTDISRLLDSVRSMPGGTYVQYVQAQTADEMVAKVLANSEDSFVSAAYLTQLNWTGSGELDYVVYYNETISHSLTVALQRLSQGFCNGLPGSADCKLDVTLALMADKRGSSGEPVEVEIDDGPHIDPASIETVSRRIMITVCLLMTVMSTLSNYITAIVKEKEYGLKRMLFLHLGGQTKTQQSAIYWLASFLFDYSLYTIVSVVMFALVLIFSADLVSSDVLLAWSVCIVLFGLAMLPFIYCWSLLFSSHSSALSYMSYLSTFQMLAISIDFVLSMIPGTCQQTTEIARIVELFLPLIAFGRAMMRAGTMEWAPVRTKCVEFAIKSVEAANLENPHEWLESEGAEMLKAFSGHGTEPNDLSVWGWDQTGQCCVALIVSLVAYSSLLVLVDHWQMYPTVAHHRMQMFRDRVGGWFGRQSNREVYSTVEGDEQSSDLESPHNNVVQAVHVTKIYNPKKKVPNGAEASAAAGDESDAPVLNANGQVVALNNVSFSVEKADCVALLGVNGSGKSTMFEILTSGIAPTSGRVMVGKHDVTQQPREASRVFGYCPQTNILFNELTAREHIELFYALRCPHLSASQVRDAVEDLLRRLDLFPVERTQASHVSGGNKRRLMLALSLLSDDVALLLLDEPSAGVDVVARRLMWRVLHQKQHGLVTGLASQLGRSPQRAACLFTTHSMEEAEAVCANAVVLHKGKRVWAGSIPDLKQHAARGISISLRLDSQRLWEPSRVQQYIDRIRTLLTKRHGSRRSHEKVPLADLEAAYEACRLFFYTRDTVVIGEESMVDASDRVAPPPRHANWVACLLQRLENDIATGMNDNNSSSNAGTSDGGDVVGMPVVEFVKEWLLQEQFELIEAQLFEKQLSRRSGEDVTSVELQNAHGSGSQSSAAYETTCNERCTLADVFALLQAQKQPLAILRYSVSELSLERVFHQLTA
ncbi:TPA: hypothetical protein N0F65_006588 [Lagenidium giganteum]|uniref:ABC transporter domain-containing protein n=1 Tax=Lagenidium giganteum TaxID=4803 RepID=A0AAV2Z744_9STRA|nr:TPA: hypothetical protein N0F65_006588 [Lagenidium giganteum]